ncbi:MAG: hypothetical protein QXF59_01720 [Candidatus Bathyarchaeia archaeon]
MQEKVVLNCLSPEGEFDIPKPLGLNPRVDSLSNKKIGLFWDGKPGGDNFFTALAELLRGMYPDASVFQVAWNDVETANKIKQYVDTFVFGVGDSGYGGYYAALQTIYLEKTGKPGVALVTDNCIHTARLSAEINGMPSLRIVSLPSLDYFPNRITVEKIKPVVEKHINKIVNALVQPLTFEEKYPKISIEKRTVQKVEITARDYESAFNEFNQLCIKNCWSDGLPLIPPTEKAVKEMLAGTLRHPDEIIGTLPFWNAKVTVEKIAINAVMAGAKPEYLPVIITAMECIVEDPAFDHMLSSEGSFTLAIWVNGPIAKKIGMHSGIGFLGHGWYANNTIGRAIRLCLMNIGHIRPGGFDMALIGRPSSHTFYTFAENTDLSPWSPYHVSRGYRPEDNCVTVSTVAASFKIYGGGVVQPWDVKDVLAEIVNDIARDRIIFSQYRLGLGSPLAHLRKHILIIHPELAIQLQHLGYSKEKLLEYIYESTKVPYEQLTPREIRGIQERLHTKPGGQFSSIDVLPEDLAQEIKDNLRPGGKIPVVHPKDIHIVVAGTIPGYSLGFTYFNRAHKTKVIMGIP